ncbi:MAG: NRDE family protein [Proteobacteria bacterium]|nr:NRDE family protein [Pseudomonadota bacterium]
MCLLVMAWRVHPRFPLVVAANRDEFHERPAAALAPWPAPRLLAGRDLRAGGTWLGLDRQRRFGVVTNFRERQPPLAAAPSRGELIPAYLGGPQEPQQFLATLQARAREYAGFNLLLADRHSLWYGSNRGTPFARALAPGVHGLSNESLDTPWPKLQRVRRGFEDWLRQELSDPSPLFALLGDRTRVSDDAQLPHTGLTTEWERVLSSPFVQDPDYGTRCSTVLMMEAGGAFYLGERRFDREGRLQGDSEYRLRAGEWPQGGTDMAAG